MAVDYELENRQTGQDKRRIYFRRLVDLMESIDTAWGKGQKRKLIKFLSSLLTAMCNSDLAVKYFSQIGGARS